MSCPSEWTRPSSASPRFSWPAPEIHRWHWTPLDCRDQRNPCCLEVQLWSHGLAWLMVVGSWCVHSGQWWILYHAWVRLSTDPWLNHTVWCVAVNIDDGVCFDARGSIMINHKQSEGKKANKYSRFKDIQIIYDFMIHSISIEGQKTQRNYRDTNRTPQKKAVSCCFILVHIVYHTWFS